MSILSIILDIAIKNDLTNKKETKMKATINNRIATYENSEMKKSSELSFDKAFGNFYLWESKQGGKGFSLKVSDSKAVELIKQFNLKTGVID